MTYPNEAMRAAAADFPADHQIRTEDRTMNTKWDTAEELSALLDDGMDAAFPESAASMSWIDPAASIKAREWDLSRAIRDGDTVMAGFYRREIARHKAELSK